MILVYIFAFLGFSFFAGAMIEKTNGLNDRTFNYRKIDALTWYFSYPIFFAFKIWALSMIIIYTILFIPYLFFLLFKALLL
jgi:hypothetical protein